MALNLFFQILNNPNTMSNNDIFFIEDIVIEFPFFQPARALYLKGLKKQNSFRYNEVLKTTAIYTADRSILFNFITSTDFENVTLKNNEAQIISELESLDVSIKENIDQFEQNATDEEVEKLNHLIESHDIKSAYKEQELPEFNDLNDFFKTSNETIENKEIDLIKESETEKNAFSFDKLDEEVKEENTMTFEEEIEKIANEFLKKIESENRTFEPDPEFKLEDAPDINEKSPMNDLNIEIDPNEKVETQHDTVENREKLDVLLNYVIEEKIKNEIENEIRSHFNQLENESTSIQENEKSKILGDNETIENKEIDLIKESETEKNAFSFDKLEEEVKEENTMTFEEEIEKIANEFLKKIESENRTFEPDPEFKLEDAPDINEKSPMNDLNIEIDPNEKVETQQDTVENREKLDVLLNYNIEEKIKNEIENEIRSHFNQLENEPKSIDESAFEKSNVHGNIDLENELISHFKKFESAESSEILHQKEDGIENEMREHFKKIENQSIEDESTTIRDDFDKKEQIKREIIDYFTHLDKDVVLDDVLFEKMTHDLPEELKLEIENEIIIHFTQSSTLIETESNEKIENKPAIEPIESDMMAHFNKLSSTLSEETEIPNSPVEDPIEKELRALFAKYIQEEKINEFGTPENMGVQEKVQPVITIEKTEEAIEQEEIVFELLPNEIFSQTLTDEKTNIEEKIDLHLDEDFSPPVQFHRNDAHSFNEWLKLSTFKPINREIEPENTISVDEKMEIIDEFIEKNPKIEPIKDVVVKSEHLNQNFDNEEIMTETLARVYVMQHKYSDAIRSYEILCLKFPEKSSFFADQIKQIENIRRNNLH